MDELNTHVRVLAISPNQNETAVLSSILGHSAWTLETVTNLAAAKEILDSCHFHVVLCDQALPDGSWRHILQLTAAQPDPPQVIVVARDADERLWAEVLNLGAWDVLVCPFHPKEVYRTIHLAWQHWTDACRRNRPASSPQKKPASRPGNPQTLVAGLG
jgi:DNA-binding NtrC family response regulator